MTVKTSVMKEALPIRLTNFYLSVAGFAIVSNKVGRIIVNVVMAYSILAIYSANAITGTDFFFCWGSFYDFVYSVIAFGTCFIVQLKFGCFMLQRKRYLKLMAYTKKTLWTQYHNEYGKVVIRQCQKQAMFFIVLFTILAQSVGICYIVQPIITMLGNNGTTRVFPFNIWIGPIAYVSPWYELVFATEVLACQHTAICYYCFDNYLALINIFVSGQFKILRNRLETLFDDRKINDNRRFHRSHAAISHEFKECVKQHQLLIELIQEVEAIYTLVNLFQVLIFSFLICFVGYQLLLPGNTLMRRILFIAYFSGCFTQLFTFAFTANNLTVASLEVGEGPWHSKWYTRLRTGRGRALARDLQMVIMRAQRPCRLTAYGFFPITVNTFKSMLSTAFSYLTLMRKSEQRTAEN